jgi:hypothetical protein
MQKIPTLFLRNPENMKLVTHEVNPEAAWVLAGEGTPTRKKDGTNVRVTVRGGYPGYAEKRRNPTREEKSNGAEPGYVIADELDPANQHILSAITHTVYTDWPDGVYPCEALGPKIQGGIESSVPVVYPFTFRPEVLFDFPEECTFFTIRDYLAEHVIEGIVWHHEDGRMAKIKRKDFGLAWPVKTGKKQ